MPGLGGTAAALRFGIHTGSGFFGTARFSASCCPERQKMRMPLQYRRMLGLAGMVLVMAAIFVADTLTEYAVAVAFFYSVVVLAAVNLLTARAAIVIACASIALTVFSFYLTPIGLYQVGLVNSGISIVAISITTYLALKTQSAQAAAHDAQARLLRIARVNSLGGLTTSIAHEVNQPLAAIVTSGNACQRWLAQDPPNVEKALQALDRILGDARRASEVIDRVRSLTKGENPRKTAFDLPQAMLEIVSLSRTEIDRHGIALSTDINDTLPAVLADRVQIQQVVGNLLLNAMEAMGERARKELRVSAHRKDAALVCAIEDSGSGLAPDALDHLFDAFWTTKPGGIGLGLSISRTIVEANGGKIWAESNASGGASFRFSVPIAKGKA